MATTSDLAPGRKPASNSSRTSRAKDDATESVSEENIEAQIAQLQADLKGIAASLAKLSGDKLGEARDIAQGEVRHLRRQGQHVIEDVQEQAGAMERQLKDTIREKPITAVAAAIGIGYILALLGRR